MQKEGSFLIPSLTIQNTVTTMQEINQNSVSTVCFSLQRKSLTNIKNVKKNNYMLCIYVYIYLCIYVFMYICYVFMYIYLLPLMVLCKICSNSWGSLVFWRQSIVSCESWTIKKAEHPRIDAFKLWYWRRFWRFPWTVKISNQLIVKEIHPEYSLEGLMLKPKLQYLSIWCGKLTHWKRPRYWKGLRPGGQGGNREWDDWIASKTQWTWVWANSGR